MRLRLLLCLFAILAMPTSPAVAAQPGGSLSGTVSTSWTSDAWNGSATLRLIPGAGARDQAVALLNASGNTNRKVLPMWIQGASLDAFASTQTIDYACDPENPSGGHFHQVRTATAITQPLLPFFVSLPELNLLTGRGIVEIGAYTDNPGYPLPYAGEYYNPAPARVTVASTGAACNGDPISASDDFDAFSSRGGATGPFAFEANLNEYDLPLVRQPSGAWKISFSKTFEPYDGDPQTTISVTAQIVSPLKAVGALCAVPDERRMRRLKKPSQAVSLLRTAGFPRARYAGILRTDGYRPGRLIVDPKFTSSGEAPCMVGRPKVYRTVRYSS